MIPLSIVLDGDNAWPDLKTKGFTEGTFSAIACLPQGTQAGKPTVTIRVELAGRAVLAQTTLALFLTAADAFKARYGDPRT